MTHKLGICIPYRNRENQLLRLIPHLSNHLDNQGISYKFYVAHQTDDKLLNRGMLKNIAAKYAIEDGCDYVAWHDVDMLPSTSCDYSYPEVAPTHIATKLSKFNDGMSYDQYFGGVVLFTKEQIEKTNGYSNEYWDWGQEDDDLFWRCHFEGLTVSDTYKSYENKKVGNFTGNNSYISIPATNESAGVLHKNHTISILFRPEQQPEKYPIWLVGDENKKIIEYPLFRKDQSYNWGLSFNNSSAVSMFLFGKDGEIHYNWAKRGDGLWTWVSMSYSKREKLIYFYVNGELISQIDGHKQNIPFPLENYLADHDTNGNFLLGHCSFLNTFYKGQIAELKIHNKYFQYPEDIHKDEDLVLHYNFDDHIEGENNNVNITTESFDVIENILPYRREGRFLCLDHENEGFVNGGWAKGITTAKNEKRLMTEMLLNKIDYKNEGFNSLKYELENTKMISDKCVMINVKL